MGTFDSATSYMWDLCGLTCVRFEIEMGIKHPSGVAECPLEFKEKIIIIVTLFGRKASLANVEQVGEIGFGNHLSAALTVLAQRIHRKGISHLCCSALIFQVGLHWKFAAITHRWFGKKKKKKKLKGLDSGAGPGLPAALRSCFCIYNRVS